MSEIFDIIIALNKLKDQFSQLSSRIDHILKKPQSLSMNNFYDESTVCRMLKLNYRSLLKLRKSGMLPYHTFNRRIFYAVSDIEKLIEQTKFLKLGS